MMTRAEFDRRFAALAAARAEFDRRVAALAAARALCSDPATPVLEGLEALLTAVDGLLKLHAKKNEKSKRRRA